MDSEVRREYERHLMAVVLRQGALVSPDESIYGWIDYERPWDGRPAHLTVCPPTGKHVEEMTWHEFAGTFYEGDTGVHGVQVTGVNCACGQLRNRKVRWSATVSEVAEAVFEELYRSLKIDNTPAEG